MNCEQLPQLADAEFAQDEPGSADVPRHASANRRPGHSSDDERHGGTSLHYWAQHWRLNCGLQGCQRETKRYGASRIPEGVDGRGLAVWFTRKSNPTTTRSNTNLACRGRRANVNGTIDPTRQSSSRDHASVATLTPLLRWTAFHDRDLADAPWAGWHPFPGPAAINSRSFQNRSGCMYSRLCATGGCHVDAKARQR